jgi:hypothetical protein
MWIAVKERFRRFGDDLLLTSDQFTDGWTKHNNIARSLERAYYGLSEDGSHHGFAVGSWGKATQVRPPRDLDAFFILPPAEKARFDARTGNVQSALLQEVKGVLAETYPQTQIRGDGQVVMVGFNSITVEVVPVFWTGYGNQFWMPDTNDSGRWRLADPIAQIDRIDVADRAVNGNVRALSRMLKLWKYEKNVPIKSFILELLVANYMPSRGNGHYDTYWYDWYVRDLFQLLVNSANAYIAIPGTGEQYFLGDQWLSRAVTARDIAVEACYWEQYDYDVTAGQEWQKIFGTRIPVKVR